MANVSQSNKLLHTAILIARFAYTGTDKGGHPYVEHPLTVASWLQTDEEKIVAVLHDILEDTSVTEEDLRPIFGDYLTDAIVALTRKKGEPYFSYIKRVAANPLSTRVKKEDLRHNMDLTRLTLVTEKDVERVGKKYKTAYRILTRGQEDYTLHIYPECQDYYDKARNAEEVITMDMLRISVRRQFRLYDLENSIKNSHSVEEKILRKSTRDNFQKSPMEYITSMSDIIRYRAVCPHEKIRETAQAIVLSLNDLEYNVYEVDDKYQKPADKTGYKGIHIGATTSAGIKFEVQVYSKETIKAGEKSHVLYERVRDVNCPESERQICLKLINDIWAGVSPLA